MAIMQVRLSLVTVLFLTGCATATYEPTAREVESGVGVEDRAIETPGDAIVEPARGSSVADPVSPPASKPASKADHSGTITRILARARTQLDQAQYAAAIETAERGLRIDRYAASLYCVLAEGYTGLGVIAQARNFARQGLRYVGSDDTLKSQLELLAGQ